MLYNLCVRARPDSRYDTLNADGTSPEYAVHFPCRHTVGNLRLKNWLEVYINICRSSI